MLIVDFADEFFQHILHRDDAFSSAKFIQHNQHMRLLRLEQLQQLGELQRRRGINRRFHNVHDTIHALMLTGIKILFIEDANDVIHVLVVDRDAGIPCFAQEIRGFFHRRSVLQRRHVHTRGHDVQHVAVVVELDDGANQFSLMFIYITVVLCLIHHRHDFRLNKAFRVCGLEQLCQQLLPLHKQGVNRRNNRPQHQQHRCKRSGNRLRVLLGNRFRADFAENQHDNRHHDGRNRCRSRLIAA